MIEKRTYNIKSKVVKPIDIRNLAKTIYGIYSELSTKHDKDVKNKITSEYTSKPSVGFDLQTNDNTEYQTDTLDIFQLDGILDNKVLTQFTFHVSYYKENADATVALSDSRFSSYPCHIMVKGSDSNWVIATFSKLQECIFLWEIQDSKIKKYRWPLSITLTFMLGWIFGTIITYILSLFVSDLKPSAFYIIPGITFLTLGWPVSWSIADYFAGLWPDVEFIPGPEHERTLVKKRGRINWLFSVVIIPFIITVLVTLIIRP